MSKKLPLKTGLACECCGKPVRLGHYVNVYDDIGEAHVNCDAPGQLPDRVTPSPNDDGSMMPTYRLLGDPMQLVLITEAGNG